jgi:hypothetical protein
MSADHTSQKRQQLFTRGSGDDDPQETFLNTRPARGDVSSLRRALCCHLVVLDKTVHETVQAPRVIPNGRAICRTTWRSSAVERSE